MYRFKSLTILVFLLLNLNACIKDTRTPCFKDGVKYGVKRGNFGYGFDDYYERGMSYLNGECLESAAKDFFKAIQIENKDQRKIRTHGFHYIEYFPHRELGITYFLMKDYKKARIELEQSINDISTAKAHYYLNQTRKQLLKDDVPLPISIETSPSTILSRADPLIITGNVKCDHYVSEIFINETPYYFESFQQKIFFSKELSLSEGSHGITITAKSVNGSYTSQTLAIQIDRSAPVISLNKTDNDSLEIDLVDEAGISSLKINEQIISIQKGKKVHYKHKINSLTQDLTIIAYDALNNKIVEHIKIDSIVSHEFQSQLMAENSTEIISDTDIALIKRPALLKIIIQEWQDFQSVYSDHICIKGKVEGRNPIISISINQQPINIAEGSTILFNRNCQLNYGKNKFIISAKDNKGNIIQISLSFDRIIKEIHKLKYRYTIKAFPFNCMKYNEPSFLEKLIFNALNSTDSISYDHQYLQLLIINELVGKKRFRFQFDHKIKRLLEHFSFEQDQSFKTQNNSSYTMANLYGRIVETRNGTEVTIKLIENKTSRVIEIFDAFVNINQTNQLAIILSDKLHKKFPLIDAPIASMSGNKYSVLFENNSWTARIDWPVIVYYILPNRSCENDIYIAGTSIITKNFNGGFEFEFDSNGNANKKYLVITQ